jgi:hypothetical protein
MKISFCLITLNEEANLRRCLDSVQKLADEIVVLDSGSRDATEEIAKTYQARWYHQDWLGFVAQKNRILGLASHDWVFSIDADEALSHELQTEILRLKTSQPGADCAGFSMPRCVCYEGRWIRHGDWYPDRLVRLFRRSRAAFAGGKVHERLEVSGFVEPLAGELQHYTYRDLADHRARCLKYARLWAESQHEQGKRSTPFDSISHALFRWLRGYVLRRGFLDGRQGWQIARLCAWETWLKYRHLRELNHSGSSA